MANRITIPNRFASKRTLSTSTTAVDSVFLPVRNAQPVVRTLSILPTHASDAQKVFIPKKAYRTTIADTALTAIATSLLLKVDVAAGHVIKGHTLTTNDFLLIQTSAGLALKAMSAVADVSASLWCDVTIVATGKALAVGYPVWVVRAVDIWSYTSGGTSRVTFADLLAGDPGCPIVVRSTSNGSNNCDVLTTVEYVEP